MTEGRAIGAFLNGLHESIGGLSASIAARIPPPSSGQVIATTVALALGSGCGDGVLVVGDPPEGTLEVVVDGLASPVHLAAPPQDPDRLFVVEQAGRIRIVRDGTVLSPDFLDITSLTNGGGERGLLSVAFHPAYDANGHFYVDYTDTNGDTRIARYTVSADPDLADPASALVLLTVDQPFSNHNGGQLAFGPDGMLYVGLGDGGSSGDPQRHGQDPTSPLGSILRLDVDGGSPYAIPPDNPFAGHPTVAPETWAYGLRNPWRFSFDRATGDLYIADVGQSSLEEVSFQSTSSSGGENYGWNTMEGTECFSPSSGCDTDGLVLPVHEYAHTEGCSITGGHVYRGAAEPTLQGRYFFADYCRTWVRSLRVVDGQAVDVVDHQQDFGPVAGISSFGEDGLGELYIVSIRGTVYRVVSP